MRTGSFAILVAILMWALAAKSSEIGEVARLSGTNLLAIQTAISETENHDFSFDLEDYIIVVRNTGDTLIVEFGDIEVVEGRSSIGKTGFWVEVTLDGKNAIRWSMTM